MALFLKALIIGVLATAVMDLWSLSLKLVFGIPSLNYAMVGRWIGHFRNGAIAHADISRATPVVGEVAIGWVAHYSIGVCFAAALLVVFGVGWASKPTLFPALAVGLATVVFPFFLLQPCLGMGVAASNLPDPDTVRLRSLMIHAVFGFGLYLAARGYSYIAH